HFVIVLTLVAAPACGPTPSQPSPPIQLAPPKITNVEPHTALTSGGAYVRIDGIGFSNPTLLVGGVRASLLGVGDTILATMPAHAAGVVDVTITNNDGQSATLAGALTYLAIEDFDLNGVWDGGAVPDFFATPFQLTVEGDHVVSFTCGTSGVIVLDP